MDKINSIRRIKYVEKHFDVDIMDFSRKTSYIIFPDGVLVENRYQRKERKRYYSKQYDKLNVKDFEELCIKIDACIKDADSNVPYIDDCTGEITIYRPFNRKETMERGFGSNKSRIYNIIMEYITRAKG